MKLNRIIGIAMCMAVTIPAFAANTADGSNDIENVNTNGTTIVITQNNEIADRNYDDDDQTVVIRLGNDKVLWRSSEHFEMICGGLTLGFTGAPGHPGNMPIEMGKSLEIGWMNIIGVKYHTHGFSASVGFGLNWRNYKISTQDYRFDCEGGNIITAPYPDGSTPRNSRLKIFTMQVPVLFTQKMPFKLFRQQQSVTAGVILGYSSHGSLLTRWTDSNGQKVKQSSNHIGHRRFTYDLYGSIGLSHYFGIYVKYSPLSVLRGSGQPSFHTLSTGVVVTL